MNREIEYECRGVWTWRRLTSAMDHWQIIKVIILQDLKRHILQIKVNDNAYLILEPHVLCNNVGKLAKSFHFTRMDSLCFSTYRDSSTCNKMYFGQTNAICSKQNFFSAFVNHMATIAINSKKHFREKYRPEAFHNLLWNKNKEHSVGYKILY